MATIKERKENERQSILSMAKRSLDGTGCRVSSTGTKIADGTSYMLKNGEYYVLKMESRNRHQSRMKWKKI